MDNLISFDDLKAGKAALKKLVQAFTRAGSPVASTDIDPKTKRTSGINYRQVQITMTDSQVVTLGVKTTGDIFEVKVNGSVLPIKAQDNQIKAVAEIVKALDAGRTKFQQKLARKKVALPTGITTAAPKMEQKLAQASAELDDQIATAKARVNELRAELGEPVLDSASAVALDSAVGEANSASLAAAKSERRVLKATARRNASWKEGDEVKGDVLYVWDAALAPPYAEGQYPRIGNEGWTASSSLFDFEPATADEIASVLDGIPQASELSSAAQEVLGQIDKAGPVFDGDLVSKVGRDELVERGLVERVDGDNILTAKGKGCAATLDSVALDSAGNLYVWHYNRDTGYWEQERTVTQETADQWLKVWRDDMPKDAYRVAKSRPSGRPKAADYRDGKVLDAVDVPTNSFDDPSVIEAQQIAEQIKAGTALDDATFSHALATLYIALDTVETNYPINLAEGNLAQAELEERAAEDFRAAIKVLEDLQRAS